MREVTDGPANRVKKKPNFYKKKTAQTVTLRIAHQCLKQKHQQLISVG